MTRQQLIDTFNQLLADFHDVWIYAVRCTGLVLPDSAFGTGDVATLVYGYDMPIQITDMEVTEEGIRATLSFARTPTPTFVPWEAVREIYADRERTRAGTKKPGLRLV